jgi:hypothetical protein
MNIHLPAILMFTRGTRFWPIPTWWSFDIRSWFAASNIFQLSNVRFGWSNSPLRAMRSSSNAWLDFLGKRLLHKVWSEMGHTPERLNIWQILAQKKIHHWMLGAPLFQRIYHCYHFEVLQQWNSRTHAVAHASGCSWLCWYAHQGETDMTLDG